MAREMAEQIEELEGMLTGVMNECVFERADCFEQFKENQKMQMEIKNMAIRHDIETQHLNTKIKLVTFETFVLSPQQNIHKKQQQQQQV